MENLNNKILNIYRNRDNSDSKDNQSELKIIL